MNGVGTFVSSSIISNLSCRMFCCGTNLFLKQLKLLGEYQKNQRKYAIILIRNICIHLHFKLYEIVILKSKWQSYKINNIKDLGLKITIKPCNTIQRNPVLWHRVVLMLLGVICYSNVWISNSVYTVWMACVFC